MNITLCSILQIIQPSKTIVVMSQDTPQTKHHTIFLLASAIAVLILINGAFAFWQMQQVKQEFEDVANRDLPLVTQLLPLIDQTITRR
ncbi:MAG: hypothetical protein ACI8WB_000666 [Phenylobacterium sp.]|jgi:hypothetical protein